MTERRSNYLFKTMREPQIKVLRFPSEKDWTLSEFHINGVKKGVGVEDEKRGVKVFGETRIPNGVYELELTPSPKFSKSYYMDENGYISKYKDVRFNKEHLLIHVKNVPGFDRILWHWGNTDKDTHGCFIVGSWFDKFGERKGVSGSRAKYVEVYPIIYQMIKNAQITGDKVLVEYKDK